MAALHRDLKSHHPTQSMEAHMVLLQICTQMKYVMARSECGEKISQAANITIR